MLSPVIFEFEGEPIFVRNGFEYLCAVIVFCSDRSAYEHWTEIALRAKKDFLEGGVREWEKEFGAIWIASRKRNKKADFRFVAPARSLLQITFEDVGASFSAICSTKLRKFLLINLWAIFGAIVDGFKQGFFIRAWKVYLFVLAKEFVRLEPKGDSTVAGTVMRPKERVVVLRAKADDSNVVNKRIVDVFLFLGAEICRFLARNEARRTIEDVIQRSERADAIAVFLNAFERMFCREVSVKEGHGCDSSKLVALGDWKVLGSILGTFTVYGEATGQPRAKAFARRERARFFAKREGKKKAFRWVR